MRIFLKRTIIYVAVAVQPVLFAPAASACSDRPEICMQQSEHNKLMSDIAAAPAGETRFASEDSKPSSPQGFDPMKGLLSRSKAVSAAVLQGSDELSRRMEDPEFKEAYDQYRNGGWDYFQDHTNAQPGEYCAAFFWKGAGMLRLSGPGGDFEGAMLTFWSEDIPQPSKLKKIKVTLSQSGGDPPQTVEAFNYKLPGEEFGAIALAVPTVHALLDNIFDEGHFELSMKGTSLARVDLTGGFAARDQLRSCIDGHGTAERR